MGNPSGFMETGRKSSESRPPLERISDWNEFYTSLSEDVIRQQCSRCMDCGVPFCHMGLSIDGMPSGCPLNNLIPEWNDLVYRGLWKEALKRLLKTNNFPEFTSRVCPAICEGSCSLANISVPEVTIKSNEKAIIDKAFEEGWIYPQPPHIRTGKKVAVVGSGPSGLACAAQLNRAGHYVTVFEKSDRLGGLLIYGIPNMKLDKRIVQRRIDIMRDEGIRFFTNIEVGRQFPEKNLLKEFDACVLCSGATNARDLKIEGRDLKGIHFAIEYLSKNTKSLLDSNHKDGKYINAKGLDVVIIGGGDTGNDCVATAIRQGCNSVTQLEILPESSLERKGNNPWPQYPKLLKTDYGQEESFAVFGKDPRTYCVSTKSFIGDKNGHVKKLNAVKVNWEKDENNRFVIKEVEKSEFSLKTQLVILAMGFIGPDSYILDKLNVEKTPRSTISAEYEKFATNIPGMFAAGDARRGQSLIAWAIKEGRGAARECDKYLMGESLLP